MLRYLLWGEPEKPVNQNKPKFTKVNRTNADGAVNMAPNSGVTYEFEEGTGKQLPNPFAQADWGVNEPEINDYVENGSKGSVNMAPNSGVTMKMKKAPNAPN